MKYIETKLTAPGKELLLDAPYGRILHASLAKGQTIPAHNSQFNVVVVPIKGSIFFSNGKGEGEEIHPGKIVVMEKGEVHELFANEDSEVIVTHIIG